MHNVSTSSWAHLTIFFLHLSLSFQSSSINPFSPISLLIASAQVILGLPRFLLPGGLHFITSFGNLPSSILWTCPYHWSCFVLISYKRDLATFNFCLIIVFLILSFLEIWAERRQKGHFTFVYIYVCVCVFPPYIAQWADYTYHSKLRKNLENSPVIKLAASVSMLWLSGMESSWQFLYFDLNLGNTKRKVI